MGFDFRVALKEEEKGKEDFWSPVNPDWYRIV